ncbi:D-lactate dehydrogenase (cytochrome) [Galdieria sulphuraria]|uniref:D-lactate dehydrogenase (Cytochrome) n=1 Tax=Galdieria sulphuraria TaxID=130081 RepID=M2Y8H9_GALSU|nr:D-lactate dehydrogenase (cytochrome) [Galdieria sulphuraria]EME32353.1 D-lactate dehydrogenase (cytochrome) [Galdieria sulphuraria]|eukprot:XP_005708873.1 D-lactate dehydrogenase (cytochrome) [Galdieria sulphuraria]
MVFGWTTVFFKTRQLGYLNQLRTISQTAYTHPSSSAAFSKLSSEDISYLKGIVTPRGVVEEKEALEPFNTDWIGKYKGNTSLALKPSCTDQVSQILQFCYEKKLPIVPQGGNTGLVGGSVPVFDEIVLNLGNMNRIRDFDSKSGIVTCEAGVVLETLSNFVNEQGYTFPLDLGAKGSCQIGGNLATNAGGTRFLRYGSLHGSTLGLEVVLSNGKVLNMLSSLRKDNTGYHLPHLFIGSEGTLGVITAASICCPKKCRSVHTALLGVESFDKVTELLVRCKDEVGEILSAFEFMDRNAVQLATKLLSHVRDPFSSTFPFYVLIETSGSNENHDMEKLEKFLESCYSADWISDAVLAQDQSQMNQLWTLRESMPEAVNRSGKYIFKYDLSIPLEHFYDLVSEMRSRLADYTCQVVSWGHIGDCNLHLNISSSDSNESLSNLIEPYVYEWTRAHGGSISAEHGVGRVKSKYLSMSKDKQVIDLMKQMKQLLDPHGILNPYKIFSKEE